MTLSSVLPPGFLRCIAPDQNLNGCWLCGKGTCVRAVTRHYTGMNGYIMKYGCAQFWNLTQGDMGRDECREGVQGGYVGVKRR